MEISYPASNRIGQFRIKHEMLADDRERPLLQALNALCVTLHTEPCESGRGIVYYCASELFQPLTEGEEIPEYRIECAAPGGEFKNPSDAIGALASTGGFRFKAIRKIIVRVPPAQLVGRSPLPRNFH